MKIIVFTLLYLVLFAILIYRNNWFQVKSISKAKLLGLFFLKCLAGLSYVYISKHLIEAGDLFSYYKDSLIVYQHLLDGDWYTFLQLTFGLNNVAITDNIAASVDSMGYWYDTSAYMMVRINALVNMFTFGVGIYANAVFFSFASFVAGVLLIKLFENFSTDRMPVLAYGVFLAPSIWYWTAGMHKESLSVLFVALILYSFFKFLALKQKRWLGLFLIGFLLLFFTRFFIALMLAPPLLSYSVWNFNRKWRPLLVFGMVFFALAVLSYLFPLIFDTPNLVDAVIAKKELYEALENGNTAISLGVYKRSYLGVIAHIPQALFNAMVRPHFFDCHSFPLLLACIESFLISFAFVGSLFYFKQCKREKRAFLLSLFSFALSFLVLTGLIVPNLGAILRYRSVALFVLIPAIIFLFYKRNQLEQ